MYDVLGEEKDVKIRYTPVAARARRPDLIFQAVSNLLDNAVKYSPLVPKSNSSSRIMDHVDIVVSDHGRGIPPTMDKVLGRFYRASTSTGVSAADWGCRWSTPSG